MTVPNYEKIVKSTLKRIERNLVVNKPHLIHIILRIESSLSRREANEIIKRMVLDKKIDENLALSRKERPYSFYTLGEETKSLEKITSQLLHVLGQRKELSITDASELTGFSQLVVRTVLTSLLLKGVVDYRDSLDSPVFYSPWDVQ